MVAMVVFLIAAVGLAQLLAMTTRMHLQAQSTTEATRLAQEKVDELTTLYFEIDPSIQISGADALNVNISDPLTLTRPRWASPAGRRSWLDRPPPRNPEP